MTKQEEAFVKSLVDSLLKTNQKFIQAYNLRATIMEKRIAALNSFNKRIQQNPLSEIPLTNEEIKALNDCNRNEIRLMDVLIDAKESTLKSLNLGEKINMNYFKAWDGAMKQITNNRVNLGSLQKLYEGYTVVVEMFYNNVNIIIDRLALEKNIIKNPISTNPVFPEYSEKIEKELEMQMNAEVIINKLGRNEFLKNLSMKYTPELLGITIGDILIKMMNNKAVAAAPIHSQSSLEISPSVFVIAWIVATVAVLGFGTYRTLRKPDLTVIYNLTKNLKHLKR